MGHLLLNEMLHSHVRVEIAREPGAPTAQLTVRNDVEMTPALRNQGKRMRIRTADIPDSAHAAFQIMTEELGKKNIAASDVKLDNLPKMARGTTAFSATAKLDVGDAKDDVLRIIFAEAFAASTKGRMAPARYRRKAGNWSDSKGGTAAGQGLIDL
ncbi:MAG: hypothetical protein ACK502_10560 [Alphaproteobacteria bacterium]